ncbi:sigma 54-interacting transcriptional regulator [Kyrpidia tusciae]|uniref:sigma 54-interacting transcriptional regulator n=1 Tax=Kyrpidia tusciae TaxID=33943 RepID=UPI00389914AC
MKTNPRVESEGASVVRVLLVGGGKGGTALLRAFHSMEAVRVVAVVDLDPGAPALGLAREWGIETAADYRPYLHGVDVVIEATGDVGVYREIDSARPPGVTLVPGPLAELLMTLLQEKEQLIHRLSRQRHELDAILNSTHDAMMAVDQTGCITLFNAAAQRLTGLSADEVLGTQAKATIPNSRLHIVLQTGQEELNQLQDLGRVKIITNRMPVRDEDGRVVGAVAVFRDVTELFGLAEEVTNLREIQSLLEAIINATQDAISVVDREGKGILINPAYTRLTGLGPDDVIGKPATVDIAEGESMHYRVLRTRRAVKGVPMKVGPARREVIVNVAPILVDGELKGSVGVIHDISEIQQLTEELDRAKRLIRKLEAKYTFEDIIGHSPSFVSAVQLARSAAQTPATVLLRGESGTGKELFAHAIHNESARRYHQFIRVNCAAFSESLLESELFGYEEGAFTGAKRGGKKGVFEEASGGTLFLDEIGELPLPTQAKILRAIQEKEIVRVGGSRAIPVDVRIIAATHVNLEKAIEEGRFRQDLYYRLNVMPIVLPPLRERKEDIEPLARQFVRKFNQDFGRQVEGLTPRAIARLEEYPWPGNVRELENVIGRAMIRVGYTDTWIDTVHVPLSDLGGAAINPAQPEDDRTLEDVVTAAEKAHIQRVLDKVGGNKTEAARRLGISVRNLYYKLEKLGMDPGAG